MRNRNGFQTIKKELLLAIVVMLLSVMLTKTAGADIVINESNCPNSGINSQEVEESITPESTDDTSFEYFYQVNGYDAYDSSRHNSVVLVSTCFLQKVGKAALKGVNAKCKIKVPKDRVKAYTKLFKGKGQKRGVKILKV